MDCRLFELLMQRYHDGDLDRVERAEYESHLRGCASCRDAEARYARVVSMLGSVPRFEPSSDFNARVLARVDVAAYRLTPVRRAARAIEHAWRAMPVPLRNGGLVVGAFALFVAAYRPFFWYLVSIVEQGARSASTGALFLRALLEKIASVSKGSGTLRQYQVAGETLLRALQKLFGGMHPLEIAVLYVSVILVVVVLYRRVAAARRKGETNVGVV